MVTCPVCEKGTLKKQLVRERMYGVDLGTFPANVCSACGETFTDEKTTLAIQEVAKQKGIWGIGRRTKITRTGNSLAVRIPKALALALDMKEGTEAYVYSQKNKLIVETQH